MLGAVVTIAVALGGAYGIANWQAGDTQDDVEELERRVDIAQHDVHEVMVKIEVWDVGAFMVGPAVAIITLGPGIIPYPWIVVLSTIGGMAIRSIIDLAALSTLIAVVVAPPLLLIGDTPVVGVAAVAGLAGVIAVPAAAGLCVVSAFVLPLVVLGLCGLGSGGFGVAFESMRDQCPCSFEGPASGSCGHC